MSTPQRLRIRSWARVWRTAIAFGLLGSVTGALFAQTAAPLRPSAEWLGPLFFTPEMRFAIEQKRRHADQAAEPSDLTPQPRLEGVVLEPRERRGAWIGGRFVADQSELSGWKLNVYRNGIVLTNAQGESFTVPVGTQLPIVP
ncbi:hypothetical protein [Hydrogenophilus thiooxidans]|uniref:hypothetical protein n=1 Tax=Hydrogenophilus thiooxidans TaxID=2820326 RepID=UPI001C216FAE|nr:hypothetical protein [Hydrogenophilus thiooxidans]